MLRRDVLLVAIAAAIGSLLTYLTFAAKTTSPGAPSHESSAANASAATPWINPGKKLVRVEADSTGPEAPGDSQRNPSPPDGAKPSDDGTTQDPALAYKKQQEMAERFSRFVNDPANSKPGVLNAKIESRFYQEEWNQAWAGSRESNIRTLFEANENLSGIAPQQVTCRSRNCQVVLSVSNEDQVRQLSQKFMQAATKSDVGMKDKVVTFFPDVSTGRLVFYLSEEGNMDLFQ